MKELNPITGTPYERTIYTGRDKFVEHDVAHHRAIWARLPLRQKFLNDARWWGYAEKQRTTSNIGGLA